MLKTELLPVPGNVPDDAQRRMEIAELIYGHITYPAQWAGPLKLVLAPLIWAFPPSLLVLSMLKIIKTNKTYRKPN